MSDSQSMGMILVASGVALAIYWYRLDEVHRAAIFKGIVG